MKIFDLFQKILKGFSEFFTKFLELIKNLYKQKSWSPKRGTHFFLRFCKISLKSAPTWLDTVSCSFGPDLFTFLGKFPVFFHFFHCLFSTVFDLGKLMWGISTSECGKTLAKMHIGRSQARRVRALHYIFRRALLYTLFQNEDFFCETKRSTRFRIENHDLQNLIEKLDIFMPKTSDLEE